jgi:hypothetical protein
MFHPKVLGSLGEHLLEVLPVLFSSCILLFYDLMSLLCTDIKSWGGDNMHWIRTWVHIRVHTYLIPVTWVMTPIG